MVSSMRFFSSTNRGVTQCSIFSPFSHPRCYYPFFILNLTYGLTASKYLPSVLASLVPRFRLFNIFPQMCHRYFNLNMDYSNDHIPTIFDTQNQYLPLWILPLLINHQVLTFPPKYYLSIPLYSNPSPCCFSLMNDCSSLLWVEPRPLKFIC